MCAKGGIKCALLGSFQGQYHACYEEMTPQVYHAEYWITVQLGLVLVRGQGRDILIGPGGKGKKKEKK